MRAGAYTDLVVCKTQYTLSGFNLLAASYS